MKLENQEPVSTKKKLKTLWKKVTKRENLAKFVIIISSLALLASSILPFLS